jgi:opacity protein-like surface antigen
MRGSAIYRGIERMKTTNLKLALGVAVAILTGPMVAAEAGDYSGGGLKGMRGTYVPVPAPVPIPEYKAKWYLRGDVGVGMGLGINASENGMQWGTDDLGFASTTGPFGFGGLSNFGTDGSDNVGHSIGIGAGYYFSPNFRMDITGELRMMKSSTMTGEFSYTDANDISGNTTVYGEVRDRTTMRSGIIMANGYVDLNKFGNWKPYFGGGLGFSINELERTHNTAISSCTVGGAVAQCTGPSDGTEVGDISARGGTHYTYSLAAAATAGVSYRISDVTSLDFNYRYLYVGGTDMSLAINGNDSQIKVADQHEHYIRAGLRWDIN